jgi:hypothetical protein
VRLAALGLALATSCGDECEHLSDCLKDEACVDGVCTPVTGQPPMRRDASVPFDSGVVPDAGPDAGDADAGGDGGVPFDGGPGPDGGVPDARVGPSPLPTSGDLGFVWVGEVFVANGESDFHAIGLLQNLDGATFSTSVRMYPDAEGRSCTLQTRRMTGGAVAGYDATEISVIPGPQPFSPFSMLPVGDGRFAPIAEPVDRIYNKSRNALFDIVGSGSVTSVESDVAVVPAPAFAFEDIAFPRGSPIVISPPPNPLRWERSDLSIGEITIEVADAPREVILTCVVADDEDYVLPSGATADFLAEAPTAPAYLEIRYDREATLPATVMSGGTISVTYRASQGLRYPVVLP